MPNEYDIQQKVKGKTKPSKKKKKKKKKKRNPFSVTHKDIKLG